MHILSGSKPTSHKHRNKNTHIIYIYICICTYIYIYICIYIYSLFMPPPQAKRQHPRACAAGRPDSSDVPPHGPAHPPSRPRRDTASFSERRRSRDRDAVITHARVEDFKLRWRGWKMKQKMLNMSYWQLLGL